MKICELFAITFLIVLCRVNATLPMDAIDLRDVKSLTFRRERARKPDFNTRKPDFNTIHYIVYVQEGCYDGESQSLTCASGVSQFYADDKIRL